MIVSERKRTGLYLAHERRLFLDELPRLGCASVVVRSPEDLLLDDARSERFLKTRRGLYLARSAWASLARAIQPGLRRRLERLRRPVTPKDCLLRRGRSELFLKVWNDAIRSHFANVKGRSLLVRHGQALTSVSNDYVLLSPWELWSSLDEQAERLGLSFFAASLTGVDRLFYWAAPEQGEDGPQVVFCCRDAPSAPWRAITLCYGLRPGGGSPAACALGQWPTVAVPHDHRLKSILPGAAGMLERPTVDDLPSRLERLQGQTFQPSRRSGRRLLQSLTGAGPLYRLALGRACDWLCRSPAFRGEADLEDCFSALLSLAERAGGRARFLYERTAGKVLASCNPMEGVPCLERSRP